MTLPPGEALARKRERERGRWKMPNVHRGGQSIRIPDEVERRPVSTSCFMCESRGPCRHRVREFA